MILTGGAHLAGVMGWPVAHSRSPRLHGYWLDQHGVDGAYLPLPVRPEAWPICSRSFKEAGNRAAEKWW